MSATMAIADKAGFGAGAGAGDGSGAYLLDQFEEFYGDLTALKQAARRAVPRARAGDPGEPGEQDDEGGRMPVGLLASEALDKLQSLLEVQALEAGRRGGDFGVLYYKDAQYVMAVLADEIFVTLDWPGRESWKNDLLETRLFGTYNAGDQFFDRLEAVLGEGERGHPELALVFLMALGLGFKGRYRGRERAPKLDEYRRRLFEYVYRKRPNLADPTRLIAPQAYRHTAADAAPRLLPAPSRWLWVLGGVALAYLVVSHLVWSGYSDTLRGLLAAGGG